MAEHRALQERAFWLIRNTRFMTLATADANGDPWASTVNYVLLLDHRIRLLWHSMRKAQHSANLAARPRTTGAIFRTDLSTEQSPLTLDGLQFSGSARAVPEQHVVDIHAVYYRLNFPDESVRRTFMLPIDEFVAEGGRRFYELTLDAWWLLDIDQWLVDKEDRRIALPPPDQFVQNLRATLTDSP
ncbi:pyridoxamine 5'-phosphate oxidase family protein [Paraburkholderia humisilvae]|uniref:Pyridoxamine 5'-phosphate oxidase N-terminal domain-containing protein n=1 Tax=Paraburkholderia humisilvae TaxID=627669 RepID=A0A6J5FA65_9BURK|nr:pyridoxamine 5'-phosphate oxidase family protein [Paraburkholderia humisilvae]CAB3774552.1 hypothetical protein LMG29542_07929 [Paraburkholderia humisilvae]